MTNVSTELDAFVERYLQRFPKLVDPFDPQWRSPCEVGEPFESSEGLQLVSWQPLSRAFADDFAGLERALEAPIHDDIKAYYGAFWSGGLEATADDGHALLYELADIVEKQGEIARALAINLELQAEAGDYRDVAKRIDRLTKVQARG